MEKVAIIGMGTSGMAILAAYEKEVDTSKIEFDCYDSEKSFGRGYPYREDSDELLLNLKTRKLSYDYEKVEDLGEWHIEQGLEEPVYTSRPTFGKYTRDRLAKTLENTKANIIHSMVVRLDKLGDKWEVEDEGGSIKVYDRIHLCNGELAQKVLYGLDKSENYINYIYPVQEKLKDIKKEDKVLVIGAGLSAVDVTTYLLKSRDMDKITMFSRTCVIPTVRVAPVTVEFKYFTLAALNEILDKNYSRITFEQFDELFLKELDHHGINYEKFLESHMQGGIEGLIYNIENPDDLATVQAILPPMNGIFNKVWDSMTLSDRKVFKEKYHPFMCLNRSPLPLESAEILIDAFKAGKLTMERDCCGAEIDDHGKFVLRGNCGSLRESAGSFDIAINATGLDVTLTGLDQANPLLAQLLDKRYVMKDVNGALAVIPETMQVISPRFGTLENFHAYGVLASGVQYRNNSTMMIQMTAHKVAKFLK